MRNNKKRVPPEPTVAQIIAHGGARAGSGRKRTGRKSITLYLHTSIIRAYGRHPATKLREWIEANNPHTQL